MFGNDFSSLMQTAAKMKGEEMKKTRRLFDSLPSYHQNTFFHKEDIINIRQLPHKERLEEGMKIKDTANTLFKQQLYMEAEFKYEEALSIYRYILPLNPDWRNGGIKDDEMKLIDELGTTIEEKESIMLFKLICLRNIGTVQLKINTSDSLSLCVQACTDALKLNCKDSKAMYIRAMAYIRNVQSGNIELEEAMKDLKSALLYDEDNKTIKYELVKLKKELHKQSIRDKETFTGLFDRGVVYDKNEIESIKNEDKENKIKQKLFEEKDESKDIHTRIEEAEMYASYLEKKGDLIEAKKTREGISKTKEAIRKSKEKRKINWDNVSDEMIKDAKRQGIDLTDPEVKNYLKYLQEHPDIDNVNNDNYNIKNDNNNVNNNNAQQTTFLNKIITGGGIIIILYLCYGIVRVIYRMYELSYVDDHWGEL